MALPIMIMHKGDSFYLSHTIAQAKQSNPNSPIYLLGDRSNSYYKGIKHFCYTDYFENAKPFEAVFENIGQEPRIYDSFLFFFQKWIILRDLLKAESINSCFIIDSDVMIYDDIESYQKYFKDYDMTVSGIHRHAQSGATFLNNTAILDPLIDIIYEIFGQTELNKYIRSKGGVTEMDALGILLERYPARVANTYLIQYSWTFPHSMLDAHQFVHDGEQVVVEWEGNQPYGRLADGSGKKIHFPIMHFHGHLKKRMKKHMRLTCSNIKREWLRNYFLYKILKYPKRYVNKIFRRTIFPRSIC